MKQTSNFISIYSADVFGVASALFELGGMVIMHDPSGCNSTYNTHDEPRWYDINSMVYISSLTEIEAIMGDEEKLINDIVEAAEELKPEFIAIAGTPIPMIIGTDFNAIAAEVQSRTGIMSFGFDTNGLNSYIKGAGMAFEALARNIVDRNPLPFDGKKNMAVDKASINIRPDNKQIETHACPKVNIIGATPLDFSVNGSIESIKEWLIAEGFEIISTWAMGSSLQEIKDSGAADVNLVISSSGLPAAQAMSEIFSIPYVIGAPIGKSFANVLADKIRAAEKTGENQYPYIEKRFSPLSKAEKCMYIIGESVTSSSLAASIENRTGKPVRVISPLPSSKETLFKEDFNVEYEKEISEHIKNARAVIADPMYRPICPENCLFYELPHEGFSGRTYRRKIENLINDERL